MQVKVQKYYQQNLLKVCKEEVLNMQSGFFKIIIIIITIEYYIILFSSLIHVKVVLML